MMKELEQRALHPNSEVIMDCDGGIVSIQGGDGESVILDEDEARALYHQLAFVLDEPRA